MGQLIGLFNFIFTLIQAGGVLPLREEYDKHFEIVSAKGCNLVRVPKTLSDRKESFHSEV
jgi:hypothetical protein